MRRRTRTDLIGQQGVNLASNAFAQHLRWVPRKEELDDGFDLNVEIPAAEDRPSERFLVQVKTASSVRTNRDGSWSVSIRRSAATRYQRSRHAVFLVKVDLATKEIRWLDLSGALRTGATRTTFSLPSAQKLDAGGADAFRAAVREAVQAQDDRHHAPAVGLRYRAQQLEAKDPRFTVEAELTAGAERYTLRPKEGFTPRLTVIPKSKGDVKRLARAVGFGSNAEIRIRGFRLKDSPALTAQLSSGSNQTLTVRPRAQEFRLVVAGHLEKKDSEKFSFELDAELAKGVLGWELRSADPGCPLDFTLRLGTLEDQNRYTIEILYERWNGCPWADLPLLSQLLLVARCFIEGGRLTFEWNNYGRRQEVASIVLGGSRSGRLREMLTRLQLLDKISQICRSIGSSATFNSTDVLDRSQAVGLEMADALIRDGAVSGTISKWTVTPADGMHDAWRRPMTGVTLHLKMPLRLHIGSTFLGAIPVKAATQDFSSSENPDGSFTVYPRSPVQLSPDKDPPGVMQNAR